MYVNKIHLINKDKSSYRDKIVKQSCFFAKLCDGGFNQKHIGCEGKFNQKH